MNSPARFAALLAAAISAPAAAQEAPPPPISEVPTIHEAPPPAANPAPPPAANPAPPIVNEPPPPVPDAFDAARALSVEIHGFVSQGFVKSTGNNYLVEHSKRGSFEFNEVGLNFTSTVTDRLHLGAQLFARDIGTQGGYNAKFDWFYLDYRLADWMGVRAGRTKLPFGLYNEINDVDSARVPILLPQSVYSTLNRDILLAQSGAELYGYVTLPWGAGGLDYRLYGGTIDLTPAQPGAPLRWLDFTVPYVVGGRLIWETFVPGLRVGGSLQALRFESTYGLTPGAPPLFMGNAKIGIPFVLWLGSLEYIGPRFSVAGEYGRWHADVESNVPQLLKPSSTTNERFYGMVTFNVAPWLTPGFYYSALFPNVGVHTRRDHHAIGGAGPPMPPARTDWPLASQAQVTVSPTLISSNSGLKDIVSARTLTVEAAADRNLRGDQRGAGREGRAAGTSRMLLGRNEATLPPGRWSW